MSTASKILSLLLLPSYLYGFQDNTSYKSFASVTNKIMMLNTNINLNNMHKLSDDTILAFGHSKTSEELIPLVYHFDTQGNITNKLTTTLNVSTDASERIYWDDEWFLIGGVSTTLHFFRYSLMPFGVAGEGAGGTTGHISYHFTDNSGNPLLYEFSALTAHNGSYYAAGWLDGDKIAIARIHADEERLGQVDTSFNTTGLLTLTGISGQPKSIRVLNNNNDPIILILTTSGALLSVRIANLSTRSLRFLPFQRALSNIELHNETTFFVACDNVLYKYLYNSTNRSTALDTTFNRRGSIIFEQAPQLLKNKDNHYPFYSIKKFGDFLYCAGEYANRNENLKDLYYPHVVCYNISDIRYPTLESSFFDKGYFTPHWTNVSYWGASFILPISSNPHAFLISGGGSLGYINPATSAFNPHASTEPALIQNLQHPYAFLSSFINGFIAINSFNTHTVQDHITPFNCAQAPNKNIIVAGNDGVNRLGLIDTQGNLIGKFALGSHSTDLRSVYYDQNIIVAPAGIAEEAPHHDPTGETTTSLSNGLFFLDYNLQPITSLGGNSTGYVYTENSSLDFTTVIKSGSYYYAAGFTLGDLDGVGDIIYPIIARFNVSDGTLDTTFATSGIHAYTGLTGKYTQLVALKDYLIAITDNNLAVSFSLNDLTTVAATHQLPTSGYGQPPITIKALAHDDHSLLIVHQNTFLKTDALFNFDTTFNLTGRILFDILQTDLIPAEHTLTANSVNFSGTFKNGNNLFVIGNFFVTSSVYAAIPFILCYDISDLSMPRFNTDFFSKGYHVPSVPQNDSVGIQQLILTQDLIPSMLVFGTSWGTSIPLESQFNRKNIISHRLRDRVNAQTADETYPLVMD